MPDDKVPAAREGQLVEVSAGFGSASAFELLYRAGKLLASAELLPEVYRGKASDCALIIDIAQRIDASPLLIANNLDIIHGRPSFRSQFLIASVNRSGRFGALRYEWRGTKGKDDYGCRAWAIEKATGDRLDGLWIDIATAKAEGWVERKGSKWKTMPELMLQYRAASFWTRAYAPDIALGFPTDDEVRDIIDVTPTRETARPGGNAIEAINAGITGGAPVDAEMPRADDPPPNAVTPTADPKSDVDAGAVWCRRLDGCNTRDGLDEAMAEAEGALRDHEAVRVQVRQHYNALLLRKFAPK